ncbi:hypothetical protein MLD38_010552 [Melastoma candidum]|uniref:Uncharacterized protein n=1 Tax=Melastoma candidum TaxID=119954 RepID=A0ACB9R3B2_9MYRT|nr:hypothetical protein MLD38_010552 [Melastoma candidum]
MASRQIMALVLIFVFIGGAVAEKREIYLALMEGDPIASSSSSRRHALNSEDLRLRAKSMVDYHDQLLESTLEATSYSKLYSFKHVINGFAVHATQSEAEKLKRAVGVRHLEKDRGVKLMTTYTPEFLGLPPGDRGRILQGGSRDAGRGIVIGFVDTGIDPLHPSFANTYPVATSEDGNSSDSGKFTGDCEMGPLFPAGSCNGKIVSARFFAAGARAAAPLKPYVDFMSPYDAVGHGSHVAAAAAGNVDVPVVVNGFVYGRARGMAPAAKIAVYKAVYPTIGTLTDVIAAIDQAVQDGVDLISLAVGPDDPPEGTITFLSVFDVALLFARRAGVFVAQAAGNKGPAPYTMLSFSPWSVGAASSSTDRTYAGSLLLGNGLRVRGVGLSGPTPGSGMLLHRLISAKDALNANGTYPRTPPYTDECQHPEAFDPATVQGSIVLCAFSAGFLSQTSSLDSIISTARALGFMGFALLANLSYGDFIAEPIPFGIPGILIPKVADVQAILKYYEGEKSGGSAKAAIEEGRVASYNTKAPIVSRFSSRGPDFLNIGKAPVDVLKPDVLAPGHQVWAAWSPISASQPILTGYNFALLSGTSMATAHVIGAAALIKQHNPSWSPAMISSAMSTTAKNYDNHGEIISAEGPAVGSLYPSTPFDVGHGQLNPTAAIDPGLVFESDYDDYLSFLCSTPGIDPAALKAVTGELCTRPFSYQSDLNLPSVTISSLVGSRMISRRVKNVGNWQELYTCTVFPPSGTTVTISPPWFTINPQGMQDLHLQVNATEVRNEFSHGEVILRGRLNHIVRIPLSVRTVSSSPWSP